jgi:hypothetical protein
VRKVGGSDGLKWKAFVETVLHSARLDGFGWLLYDKEASECYAPVGLSS